MGQLLSGLGTRIATNPKTDRCVALERIRSLAVCGTYVIFVETPLASNPGDTSALDISGEQRTISESIRKSIHGADIDIVTELAVRPGDLANLLMRPKPNIVHFSGHGITGGTLVLEDDTRQRQSVTLVAFSELISLYQIAS